ncbi:MAG: hypothetical protein MI923_26905 [Phycisphaerales bacterium]|nr:hypothetical protein [Phycisphaerales bacterium]
MRARPRALVTAPHLDRHAQSTAPTTNKTRQYKANLYRVNGLFTLG